MNTTQLEHIYVTRNHVGVIVAVSEVKPTNCNTEQENATASVRRSDNVVRLAKRMQDSRSRVEKWRKLRKPREDDG